MAAASGSRPFGNEIHAASFSGLPTDPAEYRVNLEIDYLAAVLEEVSISNKTAERKRHPQLTPEIAAELTKPNLSFRALELVELTQQIMQNLVLSFQQIHEICAKRVCTLDYLCKVHEKGSIYWFDSILFNKSDILKLPSFEQKRLAKRATNYLLLGLSVPNVLERNGANALEYLRALNGLLLEFESYQQLHPSDGSGPSSISRAKIPQMFKRSATGPPTPGRRASTAAESGNIGLPLMSNNDPADPKAMVGALPAGGFSTVPWGVEHDLTPGEEYQYLLTPHMPSDPDFFQVFPTLCTMLIDAYAKIVELCHSPAACAAGVGEIFGKVDARFRKLVIHGIVKEFEEAARSSIKTELAGVGRVVLGSLM